MGYSAVFFFQDDKLSIILMIGYCDLYVIYR